MRYVIDPGQERRSINFIDNICYSHVKDLEGKPLDLHLSLMAQNGNSEMRLASGADDEVSTGKQPSSCGSTARAGGGACSAPWRGTACSTWPRCATI